MLPWRANLILILKILGSNPDSEMGYSEMLCSFSQLPDANAWILPQIKPLLCPSTCILSNSLLSHHNVNECHTVFKN
jgi:hypothetical protein